MLEERCKAQSGYRFVLADWRMLECAGLQTVREVRRRMGDDLPALLVSAYGWSDIKDRQEGLEIQGFLSKPLFQSTLYDGFSRFLDGRREAEAPESSASADLTGKRVLLAEDNDLNWEIAQAMLEETGVLLERAENGQVCVDKFSASAPGFYDAILMDIQMPVMSGYEAARCIRAMDRPDREVCIIALTADAFAEDVKHCMECGMNYHISKPLNFQKCRAVLQRFLK